MMKLFYALGILILFSACIQKNSYSPMLWEITGNGLKEPSYIFGTFHTRDPKINVLPTSVLSTLSKTQRLYTEVPMNKKTTKEILRFSKIRHPLPLKQRLHPKTIKLLLHHLKKYRLAYTLRTLKPYKIWAIALMLANQQEKTKYPNTLFMDEKLVKTAKTRHIKQAALETPTEQLKYFDTLSPSEQEQFLIHTFTQDSNTEYDNALKHWYINGKPKGFLSLQKKFASQKPKQKKLDQLLIEGLLIERNRRFTRRINILLQNNSNIHYFFALGAGHLSGSRGILTELKHMGYRIKRID